MEKSKTDLKEYNKIKKQEERSRKKQAGISISSSAQVLKSRKNQKEKGLETFEILSVSEKTKADFKAFKEKTCCRTNAQALEKLLKIANDNADFWIL